MKSGIRETLPGEDRNPQDHRDFSLAGVNRFRRDRNIHSSTGRMTRSGRCRTGFGGVRR
jgi:hypothetical protein